MNAEPIVKEGGCRCGRVRLKVTKRPLLTMACHCKGCQRMSSSAFSLSAAIPAEGFEVIEGEPVIGGLHGASRHYFCGYCMSWMFTRPDQADWLVNVRATMFDDASGFTPYMETYTDEKLAWVTTPAVRSFPKFPELADYQGMVQEFAARSAG